MCLENALIYDFILFYNYKNFMNPFPHWNMAFKDNLKSVPWLWLLSFSSRINSLIPFELRAVFCIDTVLDHSQEGKPAALLEDCLAFFKRRPHSPQMSTPLDSCMNEPILETVPEVLLSPSGDRVSNQHPS